MRGLTDHVVRGLVRRSIPVDPEECRALVERFRERHAAGDREAAARAIVEHHARRGAWQGLFTGSPGGWLFVLPMALVDTRGMVRLRAQMTAALASLSDPSFFDRPYWKDDLLRMLAGELEARASFEEPPVELAKQSGRVFVRGYLSGQGRKLVQRSLVRLFSRRTAKKTLLSKLVPVIGAAAGAAWNYVELRRDGENLLGFYFGTWQRGPSRQSGGAPL